MLRRGLSPRRARTETDWLIHATTSRSLTHDSMSTHELGSTVRIHSACVLALSKGGTCHAWTLSPAIWDICSSHPRICTVCTIRLALSGSRPWLELRKVLNLSQSPSKQPPSVPADVREQLQRASILSILPQMVPLSAWDADDDGRGNQRNGTDCRVPRTGVASICFRTLDFTRPVALQATDKKLKLLIRAECDLGPLGWYEEGGSEFWLAYMVHTSPSSHSSRSSAVRARYFGCVLCLSKFTLPGAPITYRLLTFAENRRLACDVDTRWDSITSDALRPICENFAFLLDNITGNSSLDITREYIHRAIGALFRAAMNDIAYKAIVTMIQQVPHIPEELRSSSPDMDVDEESCVEYISTVVILMGSCHKIVDQTFNYLNVVTESTLVKEGSVRHLLEELRLTVDDLRWDIGPLEVQMKSAWSKIEDAAKQAKLDLHNVTSVNTIDDLVLRLNGYWRQAKIEAKDQRRLLATLRTMVEPHAVSLHNMAKAISVEPDPWRKVFGSMLLLIKTVNGDGAIYSVIMVIFSRLSTILQRVPPQPSLGECMRSSKVCLRIFLEMIAIIVLSVGVVTKGQNLRRMKAWAGIEKSVLLTHQPLQMAVDNVDGLVGKLVASTLDSKMVSVTEQLWRDACNMYMKATGKDI
ncbi:predicted protein [Postia placenta Mad-698-R]|nr:predicted protein [Postia placenta Mad-698-R]